MKLARLVLLATCLLATAPVRAESSNTTWKPAPVRGWHKAGVGLLIGGGGCLVLGAVFAGLASRAADDTLAGMKYHPSSDDARVDYQIAGGAFFITGGAAIVSGLVLLW